MSKGAWAAVALLAAALASWPASAGARVGTSCDDSTNLVEFTFNDAGVRVKLSAGYQDAPGAGDKMAYAFKGFDGSVPIAGSGSCNNSDTNWIGLRVLLGDRNDQLRFDATRPAVPEPSDPLPAFVDVEAFTGDGDDTVLGHKGFDGIAGGKGNDEIDVAGGGADRVNCGGGAKDVVILRNADTADNCEKKIRR
jgi:hypothetical protein